MSVMVEVAGRAVVPTKVQTLCTSQRRRGWMYVLHWQ